MLAKLTKVTFGDVFVTAVVIAVSIVMIVPFLYLVSLSFTDPRVYVPFKVVFIPRKISLDAYKFVLSSGDFISALKSTVIITVLGTCLNLVVTFCFAYSISKKYLPFRTFFMLLVVFELLFDVGIIPRYMLVKNLGLMNTYWSCILPVMTNAWSVIVAKTFLESIPEELEESSRIDGCSQIGTFFRIILPLSTASIATLALFFAVGHWNVYLKPLMYLSDPKMRTLQVYLKSLLIDNALYGAGIMEDVIIPSETMRMCAIMLAMLPILAVYPFVQRYFMKGVMVGSIKG